jgi:hypothetical protein
MSRRGLHPYCASREAHWVQAPPGAGKKQKKIAALMQGHTLPFHVPFAVRAWDKTKEGLCAKTNAIKNAIKNLRACFKNGARLFRRPAAAGERTWNQ